MRTAGRRSWSWRASSTSTPCPRSTASCGARLGPLYHQDHLVIDLARTTFIDSSFIAFLVRLAAAQRAKRRELLLVRPCGQVRRVLAIVGLPNVVPVFETDRGGRGQRWLSGRVPVIPPAFRAAGA